MQAQHPTGIAILGAAHMHAHSVPVYVSKIPGVRIHHVWDPMPRRAEKMAELAQAPIADTLQQVWDDDRVNAVMIFSETCHHDELVTAALEARRHVFVDKPLALTGARAWELSSLIRQKGVIFSTGFVLRRRAHHLYLKQLIQRGALGEITRIRHVNGNNGALRGAFDSPQTQWFTQPSSSGGGGFLDEGVHSADCILWLMNKRPVRVTAVTGNVTGRYPQCEEFGQGLMVFDNGAIGSISGSWVDTAKTASLEVSGTRGCAVVLADRDLYLTTPDLPGADGRSPWKDMPPGIGHPQELFLRALLDRNEQHLVSPEDAAAATAVIHSMMEAAASSQWMDMPLINSYPEKILS